MPQSLTEMVTIALPAYAKLANHFEPAVQFQLLFLNTMTETPNRTAKSALKQLTAGIEHFTRVLVACGLLMWSVFNFWLNVLAYRSNEQPDQAWAISASLVLLTCVIPFLIGLWLLFRSLGKRRS